MGDHRVGVGLQFATVPICSGYRSEYGREIGPWCRRSEIALIGKPKTGPATPGPEIKSGGRGDLSYHLRVVSDSAKNVHTQQPFATLLGPLDLSLAGVAP
jgi:hypothetical protein